MELRQWEFTRDKSSESVTSVLGMKWDKEQDELFCAVLSGDIEEKITKRVILSQVQRIFDPLGFLCPAVLFPKLMLQQLWSEKNVWDEDISDDVSQEFKRWWSEISQIMDKIRVPRNCTGMKELKEDNCQLHVFSDASKQAYGTVVFLRVEGEEKASVQLLQAKSRVAPKKIATIPRLELLSCTIGARLAMAVKEAIGLPNIATHFWSDSTTALAWIKRNDEWGTFVGNRVREICSISISEDWKHIPGVMNPADLPSRGCNPLKLVETRWWEGPAWLENDPSKWPHGEEEVDEDLILQEKKKGLINILTIQTEQKKPWWITGQNSYMKNIRVVAMVMRAVDKFMKRSSEVTLQPTNEEVERAELEVFKLIQTSSFPAGQNVIAGLRVEQDKMGLLRVKTKLVHRQDSIGFRYPVLLPNCHPVVDKLIREVHGRNCHAGAQFLMGKLREKCWIVQGRRAVRRIVKSCVICRRFTSRKPMVPAAALPENRVKDTKSFEVTGIDLAGPLMLKDRSKCWIVLFTCGVYRAVHLELVKTLSTESFLLAFVRFTSRRRRPSIVYSDNGTNFTGAVNLFKEIDWKEVQERTKLDKIDWRFNPPSAPWYGGWWERLIRSVKDLLKRMLGFGKLNYDQLLTCLCQAEAIMNNRPLTFVTEDQEDLIALTPAMFLHDMGSLDCPEAEVLTVEGLQEKHKNMGELFEEMKSRFRKEYLSQLVQRGREMRIEDFKVGDIVLVGDDNKKRIEWALARIVELIRGKDGEIRIAKVKTASGELTRPLQRLFPLEVSTKEVTTVTAKPLRVVSKDTDTSYFNKKPKEVKTRSGRTVKAPDRFGD